MATMVLSETRGLVLFLVIREGLGSRVRLRARGTPRLTNQLRLALEPRCLENPTGTAREKSPGWSGLDPRHSSCLWFQMIGVEARSLLPHDQNNGGNLPSQGQSCHLRPHAFGQQCRIELRERTRLDGSHHRRTLEQVLQIVIAVFVQPASILPLLSPLELAVLHLVIGTAASHDCETTIGPQLSLGTKPVWGLQNAQQ